MDDGLSFVVEMNETIWARFAADVSDVTPEEAEWRPLPQANSINVILRHLRIEAEWHLASLERGAAMPRDVSPELQQRIDSIPMEFDRNLKELTTLIERYLAVLRETPLGSLQVKTARAYGAFSGAPISPHFLGFHQATHLASHLGQVRALRNLYRRSRGEPGRYHPNNPTYPA